MALRLQIQNLHDTLLGENVMAAANTLIEARTAQQTDWAKSGSGKPPKRIREVTVSREPLLGIASSFPGSASTSAAFPTISWHENGCRRK